jgi:hypothetical protein
VAALLALAVAHEFVISLVAVKAASSAPRNAKVCYDIAGSWWDLRESEKTRSAVTAMDADCDMWSQRPDQCNNKAARAGLSGYTPAQISARCTTVGAHNKRCISVPCSSLNTGDCTLQSTGGQCYWFDGEQLKRYNAALVARGETPLAGHGCYRNPCNLPGLGTQRAMCAARSVPGLFSCTWCTGAGDPVLDGRGIGCQILEFSQSAASCSPVNSPAVPKPNIWQAVGNPRCQCDAQYALCDIVVQNNRGKFKPRY